MSFTELSIKCYFQVASDAMIAEGNTTLALQSLACVIRNWTRDTGYGERANIFSDQVRHDAYTI